MQKVTLVHSGKGEGGVWVSWACGSSKEQRATSDERRIRAVRAIKCAVTLTFTECLLQCLCVRVCPTLCVYVCVCECVLLIVDLICFAAFDAAASRNFGLTDPQPASRPVDPTQNKLPH